MKLIFKVTKNNPCDKGGVHYVQQKGDTFDSYAFAEWSNIDLKHSTITKIQNRINSLKDGQFLEINFRK